MEKKYHCTQDELYQAADLIAASLLQQLSAFGFKAKYTPAFVAAFSNSINDARNLPDKEARLAHAAILRVQLKTYTNQTVRQYLNALRLYITGAFPNPETQKIRLTEAGFKTFDSAMRLNWEKLKGLMQSASRFIATHGAVLTASGNMPATFPAAFNTVKNQVDTGVTQMLNTRENARIGTQSKVQANNQLYLACISICKDGQHVFSTNPAKRGNFTWRILLSLLTPPGAAALQLDIKEKGTNFPLPEITITFQQKGGTQYTSVTGPDGKASFTNLKAGNYTAVISGQQYITKTIKGRIKKGVTTTLHLLLTKDT